MPTKQGSGRWNLFGQGYAQYLSLSESAAWAEFIRIAHIDTPGWAIGKLRNMWLCQVHDYGIADLRTPERLRACGIEPETVVGPFEPCQKIAAELVGAGYRGVLAPCAAIEGEVSLTLFGARDEQHLPAWEEFDSRYLSADVVDVKLHRSASSPPEELIARTRSAEASPATYTTWPAEDTGLPERSAELDASLSA